MRREEEFAIRIGADFIAGQFRQFGIQSLASFEQSVPTSSLELVQWLRALAHVAAIMPQRGLEDQSDREELRRMIGAAMWAVYQCRGDVAGQIRRASEKASKLAHASSSTHAISTRLLETLGPSSLACIAASRCRVPHRLAIAEAEVDASGDSALS
jgi:hypothetical protein